MSSLIRDRAGTVCDLNQLVYEVNRIGMLWEKRWSPRHMDFWFRGVDKSEFSLDHSLLREPYLREDLIDLEFNISDNVRVRGHPYFPKDSLNPWE
jgi:hypothetical protein